MQPLFIYSMKNKVNSPRSIRGFSLIELMVSMAITLVIVVAASLVFLSVREADNIQSKASDSLETGVFALQVIGRDLAQAGSYPVVMPPTTQYFPTGRWMEFYPPTNWSTELSAAPYQSGIFGCDGGTFSSITGACTASTAMTPYRSAPDSMVINYFSMEAANTPTGNRRDCTGSDAGRDSINAVRKLNTVPDTAVSPPVPTVEDKDLPPYRPVFVSNRFALSAIHSIEVDKQPVNTRSLACNGNGMNGSQPGDAATANIYQPLLLGIEDLQITYGVSPIAGVGTAMSLAPDRFYTATQVDAMATVTFDGVNYPPWDRVTAVRVCMMTRTLGGATRLQDKTGAASTYLDCTDDTAQSYAAGANFILKRHIQTFALRGRLTQTY